MQNFTKKRSRKTGLPPGMLVHIGERKTEQPRITFTDYSETELNESEAASIEECKALKGSPTVSWINVTGIHDVAIIEGLGECFGIHPLVLEDILNTNQRPKVEDHDEYIFLVLKMIYFAKDSDELVFEQVSLIIGENYVISFQESPADVFEPVRERIRTAKGRIRKCGADYLAYALLDSIVDNYFGVLEEFGEDIEEIEEELVASPTPETLKEINSLKREMIFLRRSVWPLRDVVGWMERNGAPLVRESTVIYLRDVYDHTVQIVENIETYRDMLSGMVDLYLSSVSNRMNEIMKVLTIMATIFIPLTFIAGLYGMNFENMPELKWRWGYPAALIVMVGLGIVMLGYFRRKRWI